MFDANYNNDNLAEYIGETVLEFFMFCWLQLRITWMNAMIVIDFSSAPCSASWSWHRVDASALIFRNPRTKIEKAILQRIIGLWALQVSSSSLLYRKLLYQLLSFIQNKSFICFCFTNPLPHPIEIPPSAFLPSSANYDQVIETSLHHGISLRYIAVHRSAAISMGKNTTAP